MYLPSVKIDEIISRATEIIWWNRRLLKLNDSDFFNDFAKHIKKILIETKGPYVEFLRPPALSDQYFSQFAQQPSINLHPITIKAVCDVFKTPNFTKRKLCACQFTTSLELSAAVRIFQNTLAYQGVAWMKLLNCLVI